MLERTPRAGLTPRSIAGVMPPGFHFPGGTDVWPPQTTSSTSRTGRRLANAGTGSRFVDDLPPPAERERSRSPLTLMTIVPPVELLPSIPRWCSKASERLSD